MRPNQAPAARCMLVIALSFSACTAHALDPLWGAGAPAGSVDGEFQNAFVNTTTAGSYDPTQWSALSVSDGNGAPGAAYWVRSANGEAQGAYWGSRSPIASDTPSNGAALFDSDFLDNGGTIGGFGTGSSPSPHVGELISPRIDLTGQTDLPLAVEFFYKIRNFTISEASVSLSVDDGASWNTVNMPLPGSQNDAEGSYIALFPTITGGVANLSQARLKFTFNGDYYYWMVDDVTVGLPEPIDIIRLAAGTVNSITAAQLNAVDGVSGAVPANEAAYQAAIEAATEDELDTPAEIQALVDGVNDASAPEPSNVASLPATQLPGQLVLGLLMLLAGGRWFAKRRPK
ncbi:hypothetical protein [Gilvimarinus algae]|uniref:PEP-CTERM protein-sorting domain-containing protein n=1 Tax=Gilvimarinus algae TaxID=3058037 RepID=A0ABT8TGR5_9GAMM|nr:hypothetical protein [Gilvimarinus sp. SDUM040014]MDO3383284.1 hypothetical protein [Gilvimarinus sp. SDUM040014]